LPSLPLQPLAVSRLQPPPLLQFFAAPRLQTALQQFSSLLPLVLVVVSILRALLLLPNVRVQMLQQLLLLLRF
jgi:hypothetical protein